MAPHWRKWGIVRAIRGRKWQRLLGYQRGPAVSPRPLYDGFTNGARLRTAERNHRTFKGA
jgi:hypothetical protein